MTLQKVADTDENQRRQASSPSGSGSGSGSGGSSMESKSRRSSSNPSSSSLQVVGGISPQHSSSTVTKETDVGIEIEPPPLNGGGSGSGKMRARGSVSSSSSGANGKAPSPVKHKLQALASGEGSSASARETERGIELDVPTRNGSSRSAAESAPAISHAPSTTSSATTTPSPTKKKSKDSLFVTADAPSPTGGQYSKSSPISWVSVTDGDGENSFSTLGTTKKSSKTSSGGRKHIGPFTLGGGGHDPGTSMSSLPTGGSPGAAARSDAVKLKSASVATGLGGGGGGPGSVTSGGGGGGGAGTDPVASTKKAKKPFPPPFLTGTPIHRRLNTYNHSLPTGIPSGGGEGRALQPGGGDAISGGSLLVQPEGGAATILQSISPPQHVRTVSEPSSVYTTGVAAAVTSQLVAEGGGSFTGAGVGGTLETTGLVDDEMMLPPPPPPPPPPSSPGAGGGEISPSLSADDPATTPTIQEGTPAFNALRANASVRVTKLDKLGRKLQIPHMAHGIRKVGSVVLKPAHSKRKREKPPRIPNLSSILKVTATGSLALYDQSSDEGSAAALLNVSGGGGGDDEHMVDEEGFELELLPAHVQEMGDDEDGEDAGSGVGGEKFSTPRQSLTDVEDVYVDARQDLVTTGSASSRDGGRFADENVRRLSLVAAAAAGAAAAKSAPVTAVGSADSSGGYVVDGATSPMSASPEPAISPASSYSSPKASSPTPPSVLRRKGSSTPDESPEGKKLQQQRAGSIRSMQSSGSADVPKRKITSFASKVEVVDDDLEGSRHEPLSGGGSTDRGDDRGAQNNHRKETSGMASIAAFKPNKRRSASEAMTKKIPDADAILGGNEASAVSSSLPPTLDSERRRNSDSNLDVKRDSRNVRKQAHLFLKKDSTRNNQLNPLNQEHPHHPSRWRNKRRKKRQNSKDVRDRRKSYVKGKVIDGQHELYTLSIAVMLGLRTSIGMTNGIICTNCGAAGSPTSEEEQLDGETGDTTKAGCLDDEEKVVDSSGRKKTHADFVANPELKQVASQSAKLGHRWLETDDFMAVEKYVFRPGGGPNTPPHQLSHTFKFKDYSPLAFAYLRRLFGINEYEFLSSVCGNANFIEFISNAKSGQFFFYSSDGKYMIKTMTNAESKFLRRILPHYFRHCVQYPDTLITKFLGMYRVKLYHLKRNVKFVIMNSVFDTDKFLSRFYDVKGSTIGRDARPGEDVRKDNDVRKLLPTNGFVLSPTARERLRAQIVADCTFFKKMKIMDYSMLIGVHRIPAVDQQGQDPFKSFLPTKYDADSIRHIFEERSKHKLQQQRVGAQSSDSGSQGHEDASSPNPPRSLRKAQHLLAASDSNLVASLGNRPSNAGAHYELVTEESARTLDGSDERPAMGQHRGESQEDLISVGTYDQYYEEDDDNSYLDAGIASSLLGSMASPRPMRKLDGPGGSIIGTTVTGRPSPGGGDSLGLNNSMEDDDSDAAHHFHQRKLFAMEESKEIATEQMYWPFHRFYNIHGWRRMDPLYMSGKEVAVNDNSKADGDEGTTTKFNLPIFSKPFSERKDKGLVLDSDHYEELLGTETEGKIFYMGVIDVLQQFNIRKRVEARYRRIRGGGWDKASCVHPNLYADRFVEFFDEYTLANHEAVKKKRVRNLPSMVEEVENEDIDSDEEGVEEVVFEQEDDGAGGTG